MRGALNLSEMNIEIDEEKAIVDSFWITEHKEIYVKLLIGDQTVNYRLQDFMSLVKDQPKFKFLDPISAEYIEDKIHQN